MAKIQKGKSLYSTHLPEQKFLPPSQQHRAALSARGSWQQPQAGAAVQCASCSHPKRRTLQFLNLRNFFRGASKSAKRQRLHLLHCGKLKD